MNCFSGITRIHNNPDSATNAYISKQMQYVLARNEEQLHDNGGRHWRAFIHGH